MPVLCSLKVESPCSFRATLSRLRLGSGAALMRGLHPTATAVGLRRRLQLSLDS